jgi:WD40 repeat protein
MKNQSVTLLWLYCLMGVVSQGGRALAMPPDKDGKAADLPTVARKDFLGDPLPLGAIARFGTRRLRKPLYNREVGGLLFTPDGKQLVTSTWLEKGDDPGLGIQVWDVSTGAFVAAFGEQEEGVVAIALAKDGKRLATGGYDGTIDIWDLRHRKRLRRLRDKDDETGMPNLAFSPDGDTLFCTNPDIQVWDLRTGKKMNQYPPPQPEIDDIDLSPDGKTLAVSASTIGKDGGW